VFKSQFSIPATLPLVKVLFNGLMIAKPNSTGSECDVFVHRTGTDHDFSIEIRLKQPNKPDEIVMRHLGPLQLLQQTQEGKKLGFILTKDSPAGVFAYLGSSTMGIDPLAAPRVLDLNGLHPGKTGLDRPSAEPSILINDAVFYCAAKTVPGLEAELRNPTTGALITPLVEFCSLLGANMYGTSVNVAWREKGQVQSFPLTNNIPSGAYYEAYFINDPPYVPNPPAGQQPHDELGEYYKILPNVPVPERLKVVYTKIPGQNPAVAVPEQDKGSARFPCMTVIDTGA
jgi:hypothetical protein